MVKYPARYEKEEKFYFCRFIDFPDIAFTQGLTVEELYENAQDVLSIAIKHYLDNNIDIPLPSHTEESNVILVEPYAEIRRRMGHKKGCECPVCQNARGERGRHKVKIGIMIDRSLNEKVSETAKRKGVKKIDVIEEALKEYFSKAS